MIGLLRARPSVSVLILLASLLLVTFATYHRISAAPFLTSPITLWAPWTNGQTWTNEGGYFYGTVDNTTGNDHVGRDNFCVDWNHRSDTYNQPILAASDGTVAEQHTWNGTKLGWDNLGNYVVISHAGGAYQTLYAHLLSFDPNLNGRTIRHGTEIGRADDTGNSNGSHLHFCLYQGTYQTGTSVAPDPIDGQTPTNNGSVTSHNIPPSATVSAFSVSPSSVTLGDAFTIVFGVSDSDPSLNRVELWRANDSGGPVGWTEIQSTYVFGTSNGFFSDAPASSGAYWYGVHVADNAGGWDVEPNPPGVSREAVVQTTFSTLRRSDTRKKRS